MDASPGPGGGGGRRGCGPDYVTSSLCAPPPGATRVDGEHREVRAGFPPPQRPPSTFSGWPVAGVSIRVAAGRGLLGNGEHLPTPRAEARVCPRVCWGGALSPPSVLKRGLHQSQDLGDGPLPRYRQGKMDLPSYIPTKKFWRPLHPQKTYSAPGLSSPLSSSSQEPFLIFLSRFTALCIAYT